mmetsp:Transcript_8246/g.17922  ORF Transcript_8246/g.17922 Transcript_8246/m.17922 type:complete len:237 (+) Transcript_8246:821-1531(+)
MSLYAVGIPDDAARRVVRFGPLERLDGLIDVARSQGEDVDGIVACEIARHIEVVHGHIRKNTSAALDVLEGGRRRIARTQLDHDGVSHLVIRDRRLDPAEILVEPPLQPDHQFDARVVARVDRLDRFGQVRGDRLLAKHMFSVRSAGLDLVRVKGGRGADPDGVDVRIGDDVHGLGSKFGDIVLFRSRLGLGHRRIGNNNWLHPRGFSDGTQMHDPYPATTDDSHFDLFRGALLRF